MMFSENKSTNEGCVSSRVLMFCIAKGKLVLIGSYTYFILCQIMNVDGLRTTVPDEIIQIVRNRSYNRYHLPSQAETLSRRTPYRKIMGDKDWSMILDFHPAEARNTITAIQRRGEQRVGKITFGFKAAKSFLDHLVKVRQQYESFGFVDNANTPDDYTLLAFRIRASTIQQYSAALVLSRTGVHLRVMQNKGSQRRKIEIPSDFFEDVQDSFAELLNKIYNTTRGGNLENPEYATNVTIGIYIEGMSSFRAQSMDFHVDIYLSESWDDFRLKHSSDDPVLVKDIALYEELWHPDLYFANAKEAKYHEVTAPNFLLWIYPNGTLYLDTRVSLIVNCMMDLAHYPLDAQECYIRILSYAYDIDNLNVSWKEVDPILINDAIRLPDMNLINYKTLSCTPVIYATGIWACVYASFKMQREIMHHVLQSYIPSGLIVIISWFSFWLDVDAVPGRVSLCITTLLTLATQSSAARMALPQDGATDAATISLATPELGAIPPPETAVVSYAKAIDVWMGTCMAFVFGVMIEFTAVNYLSRRKMGISPPPSDEDNSTAESPRINGPLRRRKVERSRSGNVEFHNLLFDPSDCECHARSGSFIRMSPVKDDKVRSSDASEKQSEHTPVQLQRQKLKNRKVAMGVDKACRTCFPLVFIIFNAIYWTYYLNTTGTTEGAAN